MATADIALWLHNKLGSTDDLWSGVTICSQLSRDKLIAIQRCFYSLQPHVKVKLILSFLHIPRRNTEEWSSDMEEILMLATRDTDQWVSTVAEIMKTYPTTGSLNIDLEENKTFIEILDDLKKIVRKSTDIRMLPLECQFLNRNALTSVAGPQPPLVKHFALKRKPKSAMLRAELLQKSTDAANNKKSGNPSSVPFKGRSFAKKMDDTTPLRGIPNRTPLSGDFRGLRMERSFGGTPLSGAPLSMRQSRGKGVGIKLLDIEEQPVGAKEAKRRKKQADTEAMEQRRTEQEKAAAASVVLANEVTYTPDYAAGLINPMTPMASTPVLPTKVINLPLNTHLMANISSPQPSYIPNPRPPQTISTGVGTSVTLSQRMPAVLNTNPRIQISAPTTTAPRPMTTITLQPQSHPVNLVPPTHPAALMQPPPAIRTNMGDSSRLNAQPKKGLQLTKEQMDEAQAMFKSSNKVTRPEKALILGFMAGARENPCPAQGDILSIRLSEQHEILPDGRSDVVDTFFQMNYATGEWKRTKKYRNFNNVMLSAALQASSGML